MKPSNLKVKHEYVVKSINVLLRGTAAVDFILNCIPSHRKDSLHDLGSELTLARFNVSHKNNTIYYKRGVYTHALVYLEMRKIKKN